MHQLLTLDQLAIHDDGPLNKGEREAVRAILAERDKLLRACEAVVAVAGNGVDIYHRSVLMDSTRALVGQANGGT